MQHSREGHDKAILHHVGVQVLALPTPAPHHCHLAAIVVNVMHLKGSGAEP